MKKIKKEISSTLTYKPFENIDELLKPSKKDFKNKKEDKEGR